MKNILIVLFSVILISSCNDKNQNINSSVYYEYETYVNVIMRSAYDGYKNPVFHQQISSPGINQNKYVKSYEKIDGVDHEAVICVFDDSRTEFKIEFRRNKMYSYYNDEWYSFLFNSMKKYNFLGFIPETGVYQFVFNEKGEKVKTKEEYFDCNFNFYKVYSITHEGEVLYSDEKADDKGVWDSILPNIVENVERENYELYFDNKSNPVKLVIWVDGGKGGESIKKEINFNK